MKRISCCQRIYDQCDTTKKIDNAVQNCRSAFPSSTPYPLLPVSPLPRQGSLVQFVLEGVQEKYATEKDGN